VNVFGLDIGLNTIKICQVFRQGNKIKPLSAGMFTAGIVASPLPGLLSEAETDLISLAGIIKKLHSDTKVSTKKGVLGIPEAQIFSRVIEMPKMKEEELAEALPWEAEQMIPLPLTEVNLDWQVLGEVAGEGGIPKIKVFLIAAPIIVIQKYQKVMELAGLELAAIETNLLASSRALLPPNCAPTMIVDMGSSSTEIGIVDKGMLVFTRSIPTAGEALTRAISTSLSMEIAQAEQYKIAYGLEDSPLEGKIRKVLLPVMEVIAGEIKKVHLYWNDNEKEPIKNVVLSGGTANLPGTTALLTQALGIEVQIGNPLAALEMDEKLRAGLVNKSGLLTVAVGLSEKEV